MSEVSSDAGDMAAAVAAINGTPVPPAGADITATVTPEATPQATPEATPEATTAPQVNSDHFEHIARLEREKQELAQKIKQFQQTGTIDDFRGKAKDDPLSALEELGLSFDDVLSSYAAKEPAQPQTAEQAYEQKIQELQSRLESFEQRYNQTSEQNLYQKNVESVGRIMDSNPEKYPVTSKLRDEAIPTAIEVAAQLYKDTGSVPSYGDVMDRVEAHFVTRLKDKIGPLFSDPALAQLFGVGTNPQQQQTSDGNPSQTLAAPAGNPGVPAGNNLSDEEHWQQAVAAMEASLDKG